MVLRRVHPVSAAGPPTGLSGETGCSRVAEFELFCSTSSSRRADLSTRAAGDLRSRANPRARLVSSHSFDSRIVTTSVKWQEVHDLLSYSILVSPTG